MYSFNETETVGSPIEPMISPAMGPWPGPQWLSMNSLPWRKPQILSECSIQGIALLTYLFVYLFVHFGIMCVNVCTC